MTLIPLPAVLIAAALALAAAPAHADWSAPQTVLSGVRASSQFTANGGAHIAASIWDGRSAGLQTRDVGADGTLGETRLPFPASLDERYYGGDDSGFAADGSGVMLTRRTRKPYPRVRASFFTPDGKLSAPRTISSRGHSARLQFDNLAVAADGRAVATWLQYEGKGGGWHIEAALRAPGEAFGAPVRVSERLANRDVVFTTDIGARGDAIVTWHDNGRTGSAYAAIARPGQGFGPVQTLGPTGFGAHVAIAADGAAILAQSVLKDQSSSSFELRVMQLAAGADAFGAPVKLDESCDCGEAVENFDLALAPNGRVAIVWGNGTFTIKPGGDGELQAALDVFEGTLGGRLTRTAQVAAGDTGHNGAGVAVDAAGDVLVGWGGSVGDVTSRSGRYYVALKPAGGNFGTPVDSGWHGAVGGSAAATAELAVFGPDSAAALIDAWGSQGGTPIDGSGHSVLVTRLAP